jgi:CRP-like cAMP-binding protein
MINQTQVKRLIELLSSICPLSDAFIDALKKELTQLSLPKNYHLLEAPKISEHAYFIERGFAMSYVFQDGRKQPERFWSSAQIVFSPKSFFEHVPSQEFIQLLQVSEVLCISHQSVLKLFKEFEEANHLYRVLMNEYLNQSRQRYRDLHDLNARERFERLLNEFPEIEQIVSQENIAGYLGLTPQSLSRIKRYRPGHS